MLNDNLLKLNYFIWSVLDIFRKNLSCLNWPSNIILETILAINEFLQKFGFLSIFFWFVLSFFNRLCLLIEICRLFPNWFLCYSIEIEIILIIFIPMRCPDWFRINHFILLRSCFYFLRKNYWGTLRNSFNGIISRLFIIFDSILSCFLHIYLGLISRIWEHIIGLIELLVTKAKSRHLWGLILITIHINALPPWFLSHFIPKSNI